MPSTTQTASPALFLNGVYESVLSEIKKVQQANPQKICYLQPYSGARIKLLAESQPTDKRPIRLFISLTTSLGVVSYRASIVGWKDKREVEKDPDLKDRLNQHIKEFQPGEGEIYMKVADGSPCVNLIEVLDLRKLESPYSVGCLIKTRNGAPLRVRTRAGGWSFVHEPPGWLGELRQAVQDDLDLELKKGIEKSRNDSAEARDQRLALASKIPLSVQVVSRAFRRNPDVVVKVLIRAEGRCERCNSLAPFNRASDGSPYLEVHHKKMLAEGGEDSIENAIALCPNCHRQFHFGIPQ